MKSANTPSIWGVTEAGIRETSVIKSSMGIGALLVDGIGDTIRVSITGDPVEEVRVAKDILRYSGVRPLARRWCPADLRPDPHRYRGHGPAGQRDGQDH